MKIVGVTACISGVAHTYMAAELLEKTAHKLGYIACIETQGALGSENTLTEEQIEAADVALIVADINIEGEDRFEKSRIVSLSIASFLRDPTVAMQAVEKLRSAPPKTRIQL
ncbi:fructose PTS transporter subunit IIB [Vibrio scophthalmi]|uniref:protein-N(pi)-phosphohistidine--D-fructose phosphotransferase n=1 Tax=Vibrio scophthalmi TaxID=45658 RepID=A0A1E3WF29_9VIBR|nr:fructose PTS transporter subunit IIB [Vibrio scophthalmi]ODS04429.1 Protein-N(pi)-phosphohistidine--sugar phosphotransferase [Vibrio scophthalmi]